MAFKLICVCLLGIFMVPNVSGLTIQTDRIFVKTKHIDLDFFKRNMEDTFNFKYKYSIVPSSLHVFEYIGNDNIYQYTSYHKKMIDYFNGKIEYIDPITVSNDVLQEDPIPVKASSNFDDKKESGSFESYLIEGQSYGMGVQEAWRRGYNGTGVVIASTDVGVNIDNPDIRDNIDKNLSFNFVSHDHRDISPDRFDENNDALPEHLTDHGNRCCGLMAAKKDNNICCAGIAYEAKIAVLKVFTVTQGANGMASNSMGYEYAAEALSHELQKIDIFSNSWVKKHAFNGLGLPMNDVLEYGVKNGRQGKGSIFVFPTGPIAEGFANSRFTITVSSIDKHGGVPRGYVELCAATLTSVYGNSVRANGEYMVTTSHSPGDCTLEFKGTSASTAMVSGILALALQANKNLSWRDVQHLVVRSSHKEGLIEANNFPINGAGHYYHSELGFGLFDANTLVTIAIDWQNVGPEVFQKEVSKYMYFENEGTSICSIARVTVACKTQSCVTHVEHVVIELSYTTPNENNLEIKLISPNGTQSILMDIKQSTVTKAQRRLNVKFLSVQFWDEHANGNWKLVLKQNHYTKGNTDKDFGIFDFSITIYGTHQGIQTYKDENSNDNDNSPKEYAKSKDDDKEESDNVESERLDHPSTNHESDEVDPPSIPKFIGIVVLLNVLVCTLIPMRVINKLNGWLMRLKQCFH